MSVNPFIRAIWNDQDMKLFFVFQSGNVNISYNCQQCEERATVVTDIEKWDRWMGGEYTQDVWPDLSPEQREEITHCIHAKCSDEFYGVEEDVD